MDLITRNEAAEILTRPMPMPMDAWVKVKIITHLGAMPESEFLAYFSKITGQSLNRLIKNRYTLN